MVYIKDTKTMAATNEENRIIDFLTGFNVEFDQANSNSWERLIAFH